jgi:hypothetical protein
MMISIVFVHGTWARGSRWARFESEIHRVFGAQRVTLSYLDWSGRNTVSARIVASEGLAEFLRADALKHPLARRFVIAHSHGGTVALLALRDPTLQDLLDGVICLSTPFLLVRPRALSHIQSLIVKYGPAVAIAINSALIAYPLRSWWVLVIGLTIASLAWRAVERMTTGLEAFIDRVSIPRVLGVPLFIVRVPDDEASLTLAMLQGANRLLSLVWRFVCLEWVGVAWRLVGRPTERWDNRWVWRLPLELCINAAVVASLCVLYYFVSPSSQQAVPVSSLLWGGPILLVTIMFYSLIVAALLIVPFSLLSALALLPFGPGFSLFAPFMEVTAEATPPGTWTVAQLNLEPQSRPGPPEPTFNWSVTGGWWSRAIQAAIDEWGPWSAAGLEHSKTHSDPRAIATAVTWIREIVAKPRGSGR